MSTVASQGHVQWHTKEGVAYISFFHPSHNSLPAALLADLVTAVQRAGADDAVKVIVLQSEGEKTFCAGASFDELVAIKDRAAGQRFFMGFANVINAIRTCPKFVIGRIHGKAVGGGVGIASACDYAMATVYASVKLSEMAVGFGPFVIGPAVERKMGVAAFSQLAINATEWQTAKWAQSKGLYNEVFDTTEQLDAYIAVFTERLAKSNPEAMRLLKSIFWENTDHWDTLLAARAAISGELALSPYTINAIATFKQKT